ncbi:MAG TPA: fluoride efflux transporter CrcB [Conexibacter sp.]|nr:fluoride efflux transporter CrcB [Conexibacter sp.]
MRDHLPRPNVRELTAVFLGGTLGALGRVGLAEAFPHAAAAWPWTTFAVNLLGALVLGWTVARLPPASYGRPFLGIGVCGALTTFSTMQLELLQMLDAGEAARALLYASASLGGGLACTKLGLVAGAGGRAPGAEWPA